MLDEQQPSQRRNPGDETDGDDIRHGVDIRSGQDVRINGVVGGRDVRVGDHAQFGDRHETNVTIIKKAHRWVLAHPVAACVAVALVVSGSTWAGVSLGSGDGSGVDLSVVNEEGLTGARHTVEQTRNAERLGDAASWCHLVAPGDGTCESTMGPVFAEKSASYRERVDEIGLGEPEDTAAGAQVMLSWKGEDQGTVRLVRTGGRWQIDPTDYAFLKVCRAGVFLSLVDARSQELQCSGFQIPTT
ncbi:hypothetical protein [Streptomyces sp. enrichment culture]|uniref:hypothetical protein n=1 Tax=Streptomyces sp. enrichment culture TaxID=1795815 RepID=UPI003F548B13